MELSNFNFGSSIFYVLKFTEIKMNFLFNQCVILMNSKESKII